MAPTAELEERLDKAVRLTDEQIEQTAKILQDEAAALATVPLEDPVKRAAIQSAGTKQIRALLTPEQQKKFDANTLFAQSVEARSFAVNALKSSSEVRAQVGAVQQVRLVLGKRKEIHQGLSGKISGYTGLFRYRVAGATGSALFEVSWEQFPSTAQISITQIKAIGAAEE